MPNSMKMRVILEYSAVSDPELFKRGIKNCIQSSQYDMPGVADLVYVATENIDLTGPLSKGTPSRIAFHGVNIDVDKA